ncbi:MAG: hypothetical protein QOH50_3403 [Kribbellaceae bacterium]|jgi:hypothetical protein|nr:hypothetical protein [Kribbellaceae bacterium]
MVRTANSVGIDHRDGGRWTSLKLAGREWLWSGPGLHSGPRVGMTSYVDVGGLDECFPTVRGVPDHGVLWSHEWSEGWDDRRDTLWDDSSDDRWDELWETVETDEFVFGRRMISGARRPPYELNALWADYRLVAEPGYRFVWAAHALLDCAVGAQVVVPGGTSCRLFPEASKVLDRPWPAGALWVEDAWPRPGGIDLGTYAETDGSAVGAVLVDCPVASVTDQGTTLRFELECPGQPVSTALWRNLGGFPADQPYRSLGVEPMLGRVFDLAEAGPGDAAVVPAAGVLSWRLTVSAS